MALLGAIDPAVSTQPIDLLQATGALQATDTLPMDIADPNVLIVDGELIDSTLIDSESTVPEALPPPGKPQRTVLLYRWNG